jgi:hypothetical protein
MLYRLLATRTDKLKKMGRWKGSMFKESIRKELPVFSQGMSRDMKQCFRFVNTAGGAYHYITNAVIASEFTVNAFTAEATHLVGYMNYTHPLTRLSAQ